VSPLEITRSATDDVASQMRVSVPLVNLAPIALFVYNRPEHTQRTLERLRENALSCRSDLYIFSDGPKNDGAAPAVQKVRKLIRSVDGFNSIVIVERERNFGLAASVIDGVTRLCDKYGEVIAVEDDLLTARDFLTFMNSALGRYRSTGEVFSIGAFNYGVRAPQEYPADAFFSYRSCSWGWSTWRDRWMKADWDVSDYSEFQSDRKRLRKFGRGGGDLARMLARQMGGQLDSWAIRWAYAHCSHDAVALLPVKSRVLNIGLDGSGTHCRNLLLAQGELTSDRGREYRFPEFLNADPAFAEQIRKMHPGSLAGRLRRYVTRKVSGAS